MSMELLVAMLTLSQLLEDPRPGLSTWNEATEQAAKKVEELIHKSRHPGTSKKVLSLVELMQTDSIQDKIKVLDMTQAGIVCKVQKDKDGRYIAASIFIQGTPTTQQVLDILEQNLPGTWLK